MSDHLPDLPGDDFFELELELSKSDSSVTSDSDAGTDHDSDGDDSPSIANNSPPEKRQRVSIETWLTGPFTPNRFQFNSSLSGPSEVCSLPEDPSESDCFKLFFDSDFLALIMEQTNTFARARGAKDLGGDEVHSSSWASVTVPEMYSLLACLVLMGLVRKDTVTEYWSTERLLETPYFAQVFPQNRFLLLLRALHLSSLSTRHGPAPSAQSHTFAAHLKRRFGRLFRPFQELRVQTTLSLRDGTLSLRPPRPSKTPRFGIQLVALSDVKTGYVLNFGVRTGSGAADVGLALGGEFSVSMTLDLVKPYLGKGHVLYTDDQHNSPGLFRHLHRLSTGACGPVRPTWLPLFSPGLGRWGAEFLHKDALLAVKWRGAEDVLLLSSVHDSSMAGTGEKEEGPQCVADYNLKMAPAEHLDTQIDYADFGRTPLKWYHKVLLHLLAIAVRNAFLIHQSVSQRRLTFHRFQLDLVTQLLEQHHPQRGMPSPASPVEDGLVRLTGRHFPQPVPQVNGEDNQIRGWCHVCQNSSHRESQRVGTSYMCVECQTPLCVSPCFQEFHTLKDY